MELLTTLDLGATNDFFRAFFALPPFYWRGFLGSNLSSVQLLAFAFLVFWLAPVNIKAKLVSHLALGEFDRGVDQGRGGGGYQPRPLAVQQDLQQYTVASQQQASCGWGIW